MKYDHMIKIGGKYYFSGEDAPEEFFLTKKTSAEYSESGSREENTKYYSETEKTEAHQHTKTEINRMSTSELQNLAAKSGIENALNKSGGELKKLLIEKFGL